MMVIMALIGMTGIGAACDNNEEHTMSKLYVLGLRFGTEQARIDLHLVDHEVIEHGVWTEHPLFLRGYEKGYVKTMTIMVG